MTESAETLTGLAYITNRGAVEANLILRIRDMHALAKRAKQIQLFGENRTRPEKGDPLHLQVLIEMADAYAALSEEDAKLKAQLLTQMASVSNSIDDAAADQFKSLLAAVVKKDKSSDDSEMSEAKLAQVAGE